MKYILQRLAFYAVTAWAAITINFLIPRLMPGDPVQALLSRYQGQLDTKAIDSLKALFGLDEQQSMWQQYTDYWAHLLDGDLGLSFTFFPTPVSEVIGQSLPWTLALVGTTTLISFVLGTGIGVYSGWKRGSWLDGLLPVTTFISSIPYFWLGLVAIALFAEKWSLFPNSGGYDNALVPAFDWPFISSALYHAILPGVTIVLSAVAKLDPRHAQHDGHRLLRGLRDGGAGQGPVRAAGDVRLRGPQRGAPQHLRLRPLPRLHRRRHPARRDGLHLSGHRLPAAPGGRRQGLPLMQGVFLIITLSVLAANLLADLVYAALDPRTRKEA